MRAAPLLCFHLQSELIISMKSQEGKKDKWKHLTVVGTLLEHILAQFLKVCVDLPAATATL